MGKFKNCPFDTKNERGRKMKDKKKILIGILKQACEREKETLNRYIEVLAKYGFTDMGVCTSCTYFDMLYKNGLKATMDMVEDSKKSKKEKDRIRMKVMMDWFRGTDDKIEMWKSNLEYQESLTRYAKYLLNNLSMDKKKEIVMKGIEKHYIWSDQCGRNSKVHRELEPKKKSKIKVSRSFKKKKPSQMSTKRKEK